MSTQSTEKKDGVIVSVPVSPLYVLLTNLGIPIALQLFGKVNFKYWYNVGARIPSPPVALTSSLPKSLTRDNNSLSWRGIIGALLVLGGFFMESSGKKAMAKVDVKPPHGAVVPNLVTGGSFQYTRNPLYVGGMGIICGFSLLLDNYLHLIGLVPTYIYLQAFVVPKEEQGLLNYFGKQYENYCKKVPRWLVCDLNDVQRSMVKKIYKANKLK